MDKDYLIKKWLTNDLTEEEQNAFEALEDHDLHIAIIEEGKRFKASNFSDVPNFDQLEGRLEQKIPVRKLAWKRKLTIAASLLLVSFATYFLLFTDNLEHFETLATEKTTIELPDGSMATLNALTEVSYSEKKWEQKRALALNGEAYFKVAKGKVFDVITSEGTVTVVGTEFNVKQRKDYFEVICYEGIVKVVSGSHTHELTAGKTFRIYMGDASLNTTSNELPKWTLNISEFKAVPFKEVVNELERQYDISVTYDPGYAERLFTGGFVHNDLENALESLTSPQDLNYKIESSNQVRLTNGDR
ncbi:MAG: FecR family protein [Bacteroidota bacterium]